MVVPEARLVCRVDSAVVVDSVVECLCLAWVPMECQVRLVLLIHFLAADLLEPVDLEWLAEA